MVVEVDVNMRTQIVTNEQGKMIFHWFAHPIFTQKKNLAFLTVQENCHQTSPFLLEVARTLFLVKRRSFLFFTLWTIEKHESSPFVPLYTLKKMLLAYPWPVCLTSKDGHILFVNGAFSQALGYSSHSLVGLSFVDLLLEPLPDGAELHTKIHRLKTADNYVVGMILSHVMEEEDYVALFLFPANLALQGGSDRERLEHLPLPAALLDENGGIQQWNHLLQEILSFRFLPTLAQWIGEQDRYAFSQQLRRLRKVSSGCGSITIHLKNQDHKSFLIFLKYITNHNRYAPGQFFAIFTMEDHLIPMKEADPQKMQLLGQLASGIVHDFNNLLTGILGFCDLLLQRHSPEEASFTDIQQIKQSAMRAARLIQKLLAFSKSSPPCEASIPLKQCLKDLFPLMYRMVGPRILITLEEKESSPFFIYGDASQLEQALLNLALNARDAMTGGGVLTFCLRTLSLRHQHPVMKGMLSPKKYVIVDVKDTGTGISPQDIPRIFEPFFSRKDPGQGTGLGLSNVLQIMEQFHGGITVDTQLGKGTSFSLYFPESKVRQPLPHKKKVDLVSSPEVAMAIRILLVEDEDPVRLFAARALREKGHEVIEARNGAQALKVAQTDLNLHIVVTDVMMPGVDGPSLAASLRKLIPGIKILFVSGYPEEEMRNHLPAEMDSVYFLAKPFALVDLLNKVQELVAA